MIQGEPDVASLCIPGSATRKARALHEVKVEGEMYGQFSTWQMRYGCAQGSFLLVNMARLGSGANCFFRVKTDFNTGEIGQWQSV